MSCPDELTLMMFVDAELEPGTQRGLVQHLATCDACVGLVAALRVETTALHQTLREASPKVRATQSVAPTTPSGLGRSPSARPAARAPGHASIAAASPSEDRATSGSTAPLVGALGTIGAIGTVDAAVTALGALVGASLLQVGLGWFADTSRIMLPDWLNPLHASGRVNMATTLAWYLVDEGDTIMSVATTVGLASALVSLIVMGYTELRPTSRRATRALFLLLPLLLSASLPAPAEALEIRRAQNGDVVVAAGDTVDDTVVAMGDEVVIDGVINGDLVALARRVRVRGTVNGNVFAFARDVELGGTVQGSAFLFGQTLAARGTTAGNVTAFGQTVTMPTDGRAQGNVTTFSETATLEGPVGRDVTSFGQRLEVAGAVGRRVTFYGQELAVRPGARIEGTVTANVTSRDNVRVDPRATVVGATDVRIRVDEEPQSRYTTVGFYVRQALRLAAAFVAGWLLFWLLPGLAHMRLDKGGALLVSGLVGLVTVIATPILAVVTGITVVGLPLAIVGLMLFATLLYFAKVILALQAGRALLGDAAGQRLAAALLLGLFAMVCVVNLPFVGGVLNVLLTLVGLGVLVERIRRWLGERSPVPAAGA